MHKRTQRNKRTIRIPAVLLCAALVFSSPALVPLTAYGETDGSETSQTAADSLSCEDIYSADELSLLANGLYMPDVTAQMCSAQYWASRAEKPDDVLASEEEIDAINLLIRQEPECNINDLRNWTEETFNGTALQKSYLDSLDEEFEYLYNSGVRYDTEGNKYNNREDAWRIIYEPLIPNCIDPDASDNMPVKFAVCTTRTNLLTFPTERSLPDDFSDPDFDYQYQSMVRVNEPLVLRLKSADGKYYMAKSMCCSGWIPAEDVAICQDIDEWKSAWDIPSDHVLVVYGDKIYTEDSNYAPQTANRLLPMGTVLRLADQEEWSGLINNRSAYNNHIVWMPVRRDDGSYVRELALIGENRPVSEGWLPLTTSNILMVAFQQLGDAYGWGGMLGSDDCSGFVRNVYQCFGLELARNTTWQNEQPVKKFNLTNLSDKDKTEIIEALPPGAVLIFRGHEMLYLGSENGHLYVLSSVSSAYVNGDRTRVRGGVVNTLEIRRGNGNTWLQDLITAEIPYYDAEHEYPVNPPENPVREFVARLYEVCLDRELDEDGLNNWTNLLETGEKPGIEVARGFIFSQEFLNKNYCNKHFVEQLYKAFMGREYDEGGLAYWIGRLESGSTREEVFNGFAVSEEFSRLCEEYGILSGGPIGISAYGTVPKGPCQKVTDGVICGAEDGVTAFVKRLYNVALNRAEDPQGLENWTGQLWDHVSSGKDVAKGFIFSAEFVSRGLDNEAFVDCMYHTFFDRDPDEVGRAGWIRQLNEGVSREKVFLGFAGSTEFARLCQKYGIRAV